MSRSVVVKLMADVGGFTVPVVGAREETEKLDNKVEALNRDLDKVPPASARAAAAMKLLGLEAGKTRLELNDIGPGATNALQLIDKKLDETRAKVKQFASDFNKTGSIDSFNLWQQATKDLSGLERIKKQLSGAVSDGVTQGANAGGKGFWNTLSTWFEAVPGPAKAIIIAGLVGVVVAAAAPIGAAINGALLSGAGFGGLGLIVASQIHSPLVVAAVQQLVSDLKNQVGSLTFPFAGRLSSGVGVIDTGLQKLLAQIAPQIAALSSAINPLAQGIGKFAVALGPGLSKALEAALPVLLVLAARLPSIGRALSDAFSSISRGGKGASEGLIYLINGFNGIIRTAGQVIRFLSDVFQFLVAFADDFTGVAQKAFGWIPGLGTILDKNHKMFHDIRTGADQAGEGVNNLGSAFSGLAPQLSQSATLAQQAATAFQNLSKGLDAAFNRTMGVDQATLQLATSMTALADSVKQNGTSLKENTKEGQANLGVIQQAIGNINSLRDANIANGDSIDTANGKYQDQLDQLQKTLIGLGFNKDAIQAMIDKYRAIPSQVSTVVNVLGLDGANTQLLSVKQKLDDLNGRITTTYVVVDTTTGQQQTITHKQGYQRWGGIYEHAEIGLLSAGIYSAQSPARYAFAEPATGGEAFIPRFGDFNRSMGILDQAARWYGGRVVPGGMTAAAPQMVQPVINARFFIGDREITDIVRVEIDHVAGAVAGGPRL